MSLPFAILQTPSNWSHRLEQHRLLRWAHGRLAKVIHSTPHRPLKRTSSLRDLCIPRSRRKHLYLNFRLDRLRRGKYFRHLRRFYTPWTLATFTTTNATNEPGILQKRRYPKPWIQPLRSLLLHLLRRQNLCCTNPIEPSTFAL